LLYKLGSFLHISGMRTPSLLSSVGRLSWIRLSLGSALLAWPLLTLPACGGEEEGSVDDGLEESEAESGDDEETASDSEELRSRDAVPGLKADPTLRFVAMGDTGKGNQGQKDVGAAIAAHCAARGCDFVQLLGDNIYDSGVTSVDDPQWQTKFEEPYKLVTQPFYVVLGNHDFYCRPAGVRRELRWLGVWQGGLRDRLHRQVDEVEAAGRPLPAHRGQRRLLRTRHQPDDVQPRRR
jgi:hypothetical protein